MVKYFFKERIEFLNIINFVLRMEDSVDGSKLNCNILRKNKKIEQMT